MTINSIINNAFTGLSTSQAALRTISNNVANVNTPGYARQVVNLESLVAGGSGAGVRVADVARIADQFLETSSNRAVSDSAKFDVIRQFHDRLQGLLGRPDSESSISGRLDSVFNAFASLSVAPNDIARRETLLSEVERFTSEIDRLATSVQALRTDASGQIDEAVRSINAALEQIHRLNPQIVQAQTVGGDTAALLDQRDRAIRELSEFLDVSVSNNADGSIRVSTVSGVSLVDTVLRQLEYNGPGVSTAETSFPPIRVRSVDGFSGQLSETSSIFDTGLLSGRLGGLLQLRDIELPQLADNIGELARGFADAVNAIHNSNTAVPAPNSLGGHDTGLVADDLLNFSGISEFAIVNQSGVLVEKVVIDFSSLDADTTIQDLIDDVNAGLNGAGTLSLVNGRLQFSATNGSHGVVIADDPDAPSNRGGRGFSHFFGLNNLIQSRVPSHYQTGLTGADEHRFTAGQTVGFELRDANNRVVASQSLTISGSTFDDVLDDLNDVNNLGRYFTFSLDSNGQLVKTPKPGARGLSLRVASDNTLRGDTGASFSSLFGIRDGALASAARDLRIDDRVKQNSQALGLAKFDRAAAANERAISAGDARGAAALRDLQTNVVSFGRSGTLAALDVNLNQYAAFVLAEFAVAGDRATKADEDAKALRDDLTQRRDSATGVNLDEELSSLIVYQNSYNAAARLISTAQELYDTLLQAV